MTMVFYRPHNRTLIHRQRMSKLAQKIKPGLGVRTGLKTDNYMGLQRIRAHWARPRNPGGSKDNVLMTTLQVHWSSDDMC